MCAGRDRIGTRLTHFHMRCQPNDMRSFMRSYESATLWKTPATRSVFSASERPSSKPKCVVEDRGGSALPPVFVAGFCDGRDVVKALVY